MSKCIADAQRGIFLVLFKSYLLIINSQLGTEMYVNALVIQYVVPYSPS